MTQRGEPQSISDDEEAWLRQRADYYCVSVAEMRAFIEVDDDDE